MTVSVIISTYNQPQALELVIWGYSVQTQRDFELLIADDGSGQETRDRIERLRDETGLAIVHVWQEDLGFRKCRILNRALSRAEGSYAVISDGDCIPRPDFLATHVRLAGPGRFLSGGRVCVTREVSDSFTPRDVVKGSIFDPAWLRARRAMPRARDILKLRSASYAATLDRFTPTRATWNGHNSSAWRSDLLTVNGFDERMGYGGEDRELGERLRNHGLRPVQVRHRAVCVHLDHDRDYLQEEARGNNERIRRGSRGVPKALSRFDGWVNGSDWTEFGIRKGARCNDGATKHKREGLNARGVSNEPITEGLDVLVHATLDPAFRGPDTFLKPFVVAGLTRSLWMP